MRFRHTGERDLGSRPKSLRFLIPKGGSKTTKPHGKKVKNCNTASKYSKIPKPQVQMCKMTSYHLKLCIR